MDHIYLLYVVGVPQWYVIWGLRAEWYHNIGGPYRGLEGVLAHIDGPYSEPDDTGARDMSEGVTVHRSIFFYYLRGGDIDSRDDSI